MSALRELFDGLSDIGLDVRLEDNHILILGEDGENIGVTEIVGGWAHTQVFFGEDFDGEALMTSMLKANDRVLGFRFSLDSAGYASARCDVLVGDTIQSNVIRTIDSMLEAIPDYWVLFDKCRAAGRVVTDDELDQIADGFERTLN